MVSKEEKIAYGVLGGIFGLLIVLIVSVVVVKEVQKTTTYVQTSGGNGAAEEKFFDPNVPEATLALELINAGLDTTNRLPKWCTETYYSYRLVNRKTGGYGLLSPWSAYPVVASPDVVSPNSFVRDSACNMVIPTIGFEPAIDVVNDLVYNVHRQVGTRNPESEGEIIGRLLPGSTGFQVDGHLVTYKTLFVDGNNPNTRTGKCETCS